MLTLLAAISGDELIKAVIWIVVAACIYWILTWAVNAVGLPEPFAKIAKVILIILAAGALINVLLTLVGHPIIEM